MKQIKTFSLAFTYVSCFWGWVYFRPELWQFFYAFWQLGLCGLCPGGAVVYGHRHSVRPLDADDEMRRNGQAAGTVGRYVKPVPPPVSLGRCSSSCGGEYVR